MAEAYAAYYKKLPKEAISEKLADVAIYLLGIAEILKIDLGQAILKKVAKNKKRIYHKINGVDTRIEDA